MKTTALFAAAAMMSAAAFAADPAEDWSRIYLGSDPSVAPDGSFFVFSWCDRIWRAPVAGGTALPLNDGLSRDSRPIVSPDGLKAAFMSDREGYPALFEIDLASGARRQITFHTEGVEPWCYADGGKAFSPVAVLREDARMPVWAPDGKSFYYLNDSSGCRNVHRRSLETGEDRAITKFTDNHVRSYSISADGRVMVACQGFNFWRLDPEAASPVPERIILHPAGFDPSGNSTMRVSAAKAGGPGVDSSVAFTDDGSQIAFVACGALWGMDAESPRPVCVDGSDRSVAGSCAFSPDGGTLYYLADFGERTDVCAARRADPSRTWGENGSFRIERLSKDDSGKSLLSVSPDGSNA